MLLLLMLTLMMTLLTDDLATRTTTTVAPTTSSGTVRHVSFLFTRRNGFFHTDSNYNLILVSETAKRRHLRSAAGHQLVVPSELMWPSDVLLYSVRDYGTLCLDFA